MKRICRYLQGPNDNVLVFNPSKKLVVGCYADANFTGMWGYENPQDPIFARSRTGFVVTFSNCPLLWVSKIQIDIDLFTLHSEYVALPHSVRALLPLKSPIKEVIENLGIDCEDLKFVSSSTVYEDNNLDIVATTSPRMTPSSKHICCQVSLVQTARWKGICDSEDRVRKSESRYFHQWFTRSYICKD